MHIVNTDSMWRTSDHESALETFPKLDHAEAVVKTEGSGLWNTVGKFATHAGGRLVSTLSQSAGTLAGGLVSAGTYAFAPTMAASAPILGSQMGLEIGTYLNERVIGFGKSPDSYLPAPDSATDQLTSFTKLIM